MKTTKSLPEEKKARTRPHAKRITSTGGCFGLTPLVNAALGRELVPPARRPADLEKLLHKVPELRFLILDGAERPIQRPKDKQKKKDDYCGKKNAHRKKNLLLSSHEQWVVYLELVMN